MVFLKDLVAQKPNGALRHDLRSVGWHIHFIKKCNCFLHYYKLVSCECEFDLLNYDLNF